MCQETVLAYLKEKDKRLTTDAIAEGTGIPRHNVVQALWILHTKWDMVSKYRISQFEIYWRAR